MNAGQITAQTQQTAEPGASSVRGGSSPRANVARPRRTGASSKCETRTRTGDGGTVATAPLETKKAARPRSPVHEVLHETSARR